MNIADFIQETTTNTSMATINLAGAAGAIWKTFSQQFPVNTQKIVVYVRDSLGNFECGYYTLTSASVLTRTSIISSSNAGAAVTFPAGTKSVYCDLPASIAAKFARPDNTVVNSVANTLTSKLMMVENDAFVQIPVSDIIALMTNPALSADIAYNTVIPLTSGANRYMPPQNVTGPIGFTVAASPVRNSRVYLRLVANGTNEPTFSGMKAWGGSAAYDNRPGILNVIEFFYDGYDTWYCISQQIGATAVDLIAPTHVSAAVENATPTLIVITMSEILDATANPPVGAFTIAGRTISSATIVNATIRLIVSTALVGGQSYSVVYAPTGTNNVKDPLGNDSAGFTVAVTNNIVAPDTTAPVLSSLTATAASPTTATGSVSTNEATGTLWWLYSTSATATKAAVKAANSMSITTSGTKTLPGTGLTADTAHYLHALHTDGSGNEAGSISTFGPFSTPAAATVPTAPTIGTATAGAGYVDVAFTPGSNGGAAFIDHTATLSSGETGVGTSSPIRVNTTTTVARTANVRSRNSEGTGPASAESNSVTPTAPPDFARFVSKDANLSESGSGPYSYTGINTGDYTNQRACLNKMFGAAGVDGGIKVRYEQVAGNGFTFGLSSSAVAVNFASMPGIHLTVSGGVYVPGSVGSPTNHGANMAPAEGDIWFFRRAGTSVIIEVARAATPTTFVAIATWASGINTTVNKYFNLVVSSDAKFTLLDHTGLVAAV